MKMLLCHQSGKIRSGQVCDLFGGNYRILPYFQLGLTQAYDLNFLDSKSHSHVVQNWDFFFLQIPRPLDLALGHYRILGEMHL